jgi:hypothetical protein
MTMRITATTPAALLASANTDFTQQKGQYIVGASGLRGDQNRSGVGAGIACVDFTVNFGFLAPALRVSQQESQCQYHVEPDVRA